MRSRFFLYIVAAVAFFSCGNKGDRSTEEADTLATEEPLALLPDTVLPSAAAVSYTIEVADTATDGNLSTVESVYDGKEGWFTFRGNTLRNADYGGTVKGTPDRKSVV